jgi:predicted phage-related endonuclease
LDGLKMSEDNGLRRATCVGGSDANVILGGSSDRLLRLWREKRGEEMAEDLSANVAVMLGCWTEAFNRQWFEKTTGLAITRCGEAFRCEDHQWRGCTLDGFVEASGAVWEAKHTSGFSKADEVLARYMPQLQHNMAVLKAERAFLSVLFGNSKWECFEIASDWLYQSELLEAELQFWGCVQSGVPPVAAPAPPPPRPIAVREICLQGSNSWAAAAADWLDTRLAAKRHSDAVTALKAMIEPDVSRAFGHGVEAKRSKAGSITFREITR